MQRHGDTDETQETEDVPPLAACVKTLPETVQLSLIAGLDDKCLFNFARALKAFEITTTAGFRRRNCRPFSRIGGMRPNRCFRLMRILTNGALTSRPLSQDPRGVGSQFTSRSHPPRQRQPVAATVGTLCQPQN